MSSSQPDKKRPRPTPVPHVSGRPTLPSEEEQSRLSSAAATALANWKLTNNVRDVDAVDGAAPSTGVPETSSAADESMYLFNRDEQRAEQESRPWARNPRHFKKVAISALALLKMTMHARSGGQLEVMGLMCGKIKGDTMIVTDSFALPVEGTETRVNAQAEANTYLVEFLSASNTAGKQENAIGWYHSHPGYGCWLSGIDVNTQMTNQTYQEPFLAVVIDPMRTAAAGKVEIGAFRTLPEGAEADSAGSFQSVPSDKLDDFGVHARKYYPLEVSYFKSRQDDKMFEALWNKYWATTLSSSPLVANREYMVGQMNDLAGKIDLARDEIAKSAHGLPDASTGTTRGGGSAMAKSLESKSTSAPLADVIIASRKLAIEEMTGLMTQVIKRSLFV